MKHQAVKRRLCLLLCLLFAVSCAFSLPAGAVEEAEAVNAFALHREGPLLQGKLGFRLGELFSGLTDLFRPKEARRNTDVGRAPTDDGVRGVAYAASGADKTAVGAVTAFAAGENIVDSAAVFTAEGSAVGTVTVKMKESGHITPDAAQAAVSLSAEDVAATDPDVTGAEAPGDDGSDCVHAFPFAAGARGDNAADLPVGRSLPKQLCAGGQTFGVRMYAEGVMIVGDGKDKDIHPAYDAGVREQDILLAVDGKRVRCADDVKCELEKATGDRILLTCLRDGVKLEFSMVPHRDSEGKIKAGIFLRDSLAGIGTVTYYDPETGAFGGLGHGIGDGTSGRLMPLSRGAVLDVRITRIVRGECGHPGEMRGYLRTDKQGVLLKNTDCGVFGVFSPAPQAARVLPVGSREELHAGKATLLCSLGGEEVRSYSVTLGAVDRGARGAKCFSVTVDDPALLAATGGIIQGMSGSPIVQDGKLVGAVTHVLVGDPTRGYGIFIENMLQAEGH